MRIPELLAPAGGMRQLKTAFRFGADAVYLGLAQYGLRAFAGNFTPESLCEAVRYAHALGKKVYVTLNVFPTDAQIEGLMEAAHCIADAGADAAIVSDLGAVATLRERVPGLPLHISTQANTMNAAAARAWHAMGAQRVILARELSLAQIAAMRAALPESLALEAFVHGAVCMSYSGRCLLSAAMTGRGANQGACAQPCRWTYTLTEEKRPDQPMTLEQDAHGTTVLSARDLCMIEHVPALCAAGLASLKIEGRMKGEYYVAVVVGAYRRALDACALDAAGYARDTALQATLLAELHQTSHHLSDTGFYFGAPEQPGEAGPYIQGSEYVGYVLEAAHGEGLIEVKNRFFVGDTLEAVTPQGIVPVTVTAIRLADTGEAVDVIQRPNALVRVPLPEGVGEGDLLRGKCRNHPQG